MSDPLLNTVFADYEIRERIKPGGMAIVYKAYDTRRKLIVALKILQESLAEHPEFRERFKREGKIAQKLRHPHIVQFFDTDSFNDRLYIAMQYMAGGSMVDVLMADPQITLGRTALLLQQLGSALDYAHHEGVVHRDLKLGNVLLDESGHAMLTDFGIARLHDATQVLTQEKHQMPGTVKYMSPEQVRGFVDLDYRSDLYSFAVIAYLLATGRYPFTGTNDIVILNQHLNMEPPPPSRVNPSLPPRLDDVLLKGLAKKPEDRYPSAGRFAEAFTAAISGYEALPVAVNMRAENPALADFSAERIATLEPTLNQPAIPAAMAAFQDTHGETIALGGKIADAPRYALWALALILLLGVVLIVMLILPPSELVLELTATPSEMAIAARETHTAGTQIAAEQTAEVLAPTETHTASLTATLTATSTETHTFTPTFTSTATLTPTLTATSTPTLTATVPPLVTTVPPRPSVTVTPLFSAVSPLIRWFNTLGTQSQFDCRGFVLAYEFLEGRVAANDPTFTPLAELVNQEDDALPRIYRQFCAPDPENTQAFIDFDVYIELFEVLKQYE